MPPHRHTLGWIYLVHSLGGSEPGRINIKLGWATTPTERIRMMQWGNPHRLILVGMYEGTVEDENKLHRMLKQFRVRGEWYSLPEAALESLTERLKANSKKYSARGWTDVNLTAIA